MLKAILSSNCFVMTFHTFCFVAKIPDVATDSAQCGRLFVYRFPDKKIVIKKEMLNKLEYFKT